MMETIKLNNLLLETITEHRERKSLERMLESDGALDITYDDFTRRFPTLTTRYWATNAKVYDDYIKINSITELTKKIKSAINEYAPFTVHDREFDIMGANYMMFLYRKKQILGD